MAVLYEHEDKQNNTYRSVSFATKMEEIMTDREIRERKNKKALKDTEKVNRVNELIENYALEELASMVANQEGIINELLERVKQQSDDYFNGYEDDEEYVCDENIRIDQLAIAFDVLVDRYALLREQVGLR